jgi:hypothetical protein
MAKRMRQQQRGIGRIDAVAGLPQDGRDGGGNRIHREMVAATGAGLGIGPGSHHLDYDSPRLSIIF